MIQIRLRLDESIHASQLAENYPYLESGSGGWKITLRTPPWHPPMDVYETEENLVVRMEIAGMRESDFNIELDGRLLWIRGTRTETNERRAYHQMEIPFGEFSLEIELPVAVQVEKVTANYSEGFLRIILPKTQPAHVHIEGG